MMLRFLIVITFIHYFSSFSIGQKTEKVFNDQDLRLVFYNCENLFDIQDDPQKNDAEFLPEGDKYWNKYKYWDKISNIYKVIIAIGEWNAPQIIGLCEIENRTVLEDLINKTPLSRIEYEIVHYESPDKRGIDVALLYRPDYFTLLNTEAIPINFPNEPNHKTRDILYVKGLTKNNDSLHVFVNHWPSRWGGELETVHYRMFVASVLRKKIDSVFSVNQQANIVVMGDLNDEPTDKSLIESLNAKRNLENINSFDIYNLTYYLQNVKGQGSHKYRSEWGMLDQIIVSGSLLDSISETYTSKENCYVYNAEFLLEDDNNYLGQKPFRTYNGFKYNAGFSDHLPVYLDLFFRK